MHLQSTVNSQFIYFPFGWGGGRGYLRFTIIINSYKNGSYFVKNPDLYMKILHSSQHRPDKNEVSLI